MKRKTFVSNLGLSFLGTLFFAGKPKLNTLLQTACHDPITPPVPEGPFYKNEHLNRINIVETQKGTPVDYVFTVVDKDCRPIEGAIVDIWQCNNMGHYSDFKQENTSNETWLRGFQKTANNGTCKFASIFPGWYDGRITHLHLKVHVNDKTLLTTNCFFPKEVEDEVYKSPLYPKGPNPISVSNDIELHGDKDNTRHDALVMKVDKDKTGKLVASYKIAIV
jgi:protocatechuate 3,4-dioxygenase beta subunit